MKSQLFKKKYPKELLLDLLCKICVLNKNFYVLNKISFKKIEFEDLLNPFLDSLKEYYYESKQFYLSRKQNYNSFITIIRQICRHNEINYTSKILYNRSIYEIVYNVYVD